MPFLRRSADILLPITVERILPPADAALARLAEMRAESRRWRAHDEMVGLAFDAQEAIEVEEAERAARRRVAALEEEEGQRERERDEGGGAGASVVTSQIWGEIEIRRQARCIQQ